ncbi:MAG: nucleoside hydrolase [Hungatella sp.]|jgi:pyrimidine-specific ribonucleoside hydrolase|nr:nucleoside hydrolase [Hungatella sp.]
MKKIIIDCDPGHDDAVAIMLAYAHKEDLKLVAITTVCGNNTLDKVTCNALRTVAVCKETTAVYKGAQRPLLNPPVISSQYHGESGMDGPVYEEDIFLPTPGTLHAVDAMREVVIESDAPIIIVALAPLTNLALFIRMYPELLPRIECITLMGGGIDHGNITHSAEFNIYVDPEAAEIVFASGVPVVMSGLDVTEKATLQVADIEHLRNGGRQGRFFCELMDFYTLGSSAFGAEGCMLHDPCALLWLIRPDLFQGRRGNIRIILSGERRGQTVFTPGEEESVLVLNDVKTKEFSDIVINSIERLNKG